MDSIEIVSRRAGEVATMAMWQRRLFPLGVVLVLASAGGIAGYAAGSWLRAPGQQISHSGDVIAGTQTSVRERNLVSSLDELVRESDAVVLASVAEVRPGRQAGDPADGVGGVGRAVMTERRYADPSALRRAVTDRLRTLARDRHAQLADLATTQFL